MIFFILAFLIGVLIYLIYIKITFLKNRNQSKKITAKVIEYRTEKSPMRNDYTMLSYPYVKIGDDQDTILRKLRYANNFNKPFKIGEQIDVFWDGNDLMYWYAYDFGLYKYLPKSWNFI